MWSTKEFPTRVMFGPYGGEILPILGQEKSSGYAWQVGGVRPEFFYKLIYRKVYLSSSVIC